MPAPPELGYSLVDLSDQTGLSPRTIHYYSSQGLLPPATRRGAGARYPRPTLQRLLAIQRFKAELRLTLQEIRRVLESLSEGEIGAVAMGDVSPWNVLERPSPRSNQSTPKATPGVPGPTPPIGGTAAGSQIAGSAIATDRTGSEGAAPTLPGGTPLAGPGPAPGSAPGPAQGSAPGSAAAAASPPRRDSAQVVGGEASAQLASLLRTLHDKAGRSVPRAGSRDHWLSIPITADLQLSAHRVAGEDIEVLQRVADHLRALLVSGFRQEPPTTQATPASRSGASSGSSEASTGGSSGPD